MPLCGLRDIIAQAQSGTGKTGAFAIGALQTINLNDRSTQVIILSNTRELAKQTAGVVERLGSFCTGVASMACVGGSNTRHDIEKLRGGVQIVSGTPGRVVDMINRGALWPGKVHYLILDEADEMLSGGDRGERGFKDQVYDIFQLLPATVHVGLFSATLPDAVLALSDKFMQDPVRSVTHQASSINHQASSIKHHIH